MSERKQFNLPALMIVLTVTILISGFPSSINAEPLNNTPLDDAIPSAATSELTGRFSIVWGDPPPGSDLAPKTLYWLYDQNGVRHQLDLSEAIVNNPSGLMALNGQEVFVVSHGIATDKAASSTAELLKVTSIAPTPNVEATAAAPILGSQPWVSVMCKFADVGDEPRNLSYFQNMYGDAFPELNHYWRGQSYDLVNLNGSSAFGWFTIPNARSSYALPGGGMDWGRAGEDCLAIAQNSVYFPSYTGISFMFNAELDGFAYGGAGWGFTLNGVAQTWDLAWLPPWGYENVGILKHEMGHGFGLHHSGSGGVVYNSPWDIMANSWPAPDDPVYGSRGQGTIAFHKDILGWIPPGRKYVASLGSQATITLERLAAPLTGNYLMAQIPTCSAADRFYTVEARRFASYDEGLPGEAVIIHGIDPIVREWPPFFPADVFDGDWNGDSSDAGAMWLPGETFVDPANGITIGVNEATATGFTVTIGNNPPPGCSPNAVLLCDQLNFTANCISLTADDLDLSDNFSFDNRTVSFRFTGNYATKWQITLFDLPGYSGAFTSFQDSDPDLQNNPIAQKRASSVRIWQDNDDGRRLMPGQPLNGTIHNPTDTDGYLFYGTQGQMVTIRMSQQVNSRVDSYLVLYGPNGKVLVENDNQAGNLNAQISNFVLPVTGGYRVVAKSFANKSLGAYAIRRNLVNTNACTPGQNGIILYDGPNFSGSCVTLTADKPDLLLTNFDDRVASVKFAGSYANQGWQVTLSQHKGYGGIHDNFRANDADLGNNRMGRDQTSSIRIWKDSDDGRTIQYGQTFNGTVHPRTDTDLYSFTGAQGQVVSIRMTRQTSTLNSFLALYGPTWGLIAQDNNSGGNTNALIARLTLPENGTYRIMAQSYNAGTTGPYALSLTRE